MGKARRLCPQCPSNRAGRDANSGVICAGGWERREDVPLPHPGVGVGGDRTRSVDVLSPRGVKARPASRTPRGFNGGEFEYQEVASAVVRAVPGVLVFRP